MNHLPRADAPSWTDQLSAWSSLGTTVLTFIMACIAGAALWAAWRTLTATKQAAEAAKAANQQAERDSIEQTRPYVYAEVVPGLHGDGAWDLRIRNCGQSAARNLTLSFSDWPPEGDDVSRSVRRLFETARTLPPQCSLRTLWRLEGQFTTGEAMVGMPKAGRIGVAYTSTDPSHPEYRDDFDVLLEDSGLWPVPEAGPEPTGLSAEQRKFYELGRSIARHIAEGHR